MNKVKKIIKYFVLLVIFLLLAYTGFKLWIKHNINAYQIPVLAYHDIVLDENHVNGAFSLTVENFENQLKYLKDNNYSTLTLDEFYCWKKGKCKIPEKSVLLTFDDGYYSVYYLVKPLLEKYNYNAVSFIIGSTTGEITEPYNPDLYATTGKDHIKKEDKTIDYQSHTYNLHKMMNKRPKLLSSSEKDLDKDFEKMSEIKNFKYMAYPYYTENRLIRKSLKRHRYKLAFRGEEEKTVKNVNDYQVPRIDINNDFNKFKDVFETKKYNNRYANGVIRKVFINIERKLNIKL